MSVVDFGVAVTTGDFDRVVANTHDGLGLEFFGPKYAADLDAVEVSVSLAQLAIPKGC